MRQIWIDTRECYDYARARGYEPLLGGMFRLEINLRVSIQTELFGRGHTPEENEKFYRWCWEHKPHICEETMRPLHFYSAVHISHILTKGANPLMAHDPRNVNILSFDAHAKWENGNRKEMRIYEANKLVVAELMDDYAIYTLGRYGPGFRPGGLSAEGD